jgi:hypothetical protein
VKLSQFIDVFVAALYNETQLTNRSDFRFGEILEKYGLAVNPAWGESLFNDYTFKSHVDARRNIGPTQNQHVSLSSEGFRWVEDQLGENVAEFLERNGASYREEPSDNVLTTEDGEPLETEDGEPIELEDGRAEDSAASDVVHSETWTGIRSQVITAANADRVRVAILQAKDAVRDLESNEKTAQAIAYLNAAEALIEAPEPPSDFIWELISRAGAICGVIGLFIALFTIA